MGGREARVRSSHHGWKLGMSPKNEEMFQWGF